MHANCTIKEQRVEFAHQIQDIYSFSGFSHQVCTELTDNPFVLLSDHTNI